MGTTDVTRSVINYSAMRVHGLILSIVFLGFASVAKSQNTIVSERRQRAAPEFRDGILLLHASSETNLNADGSGKSLSSITSQACGTPWGPCSPSMESLSNQLGCSANQRKAERDD
jgi:hypothetical protein